MTAIDVDFEVYKALTIRRATEAVTYNDVLRELLDIAPGTSSLSDLSKNRDFLEYYVSRSPGTIVELRSDRYSF